MISVEYSSDFVRTYKKLQPAQKEEILLLIEDFKNTKNHERLRVHKLKGALRGLYAFSVSYADRIVFEWSKDKKTAYLLAFGDHSIYE